MQQISFIENLDQARNVSNFFVLEEVKETIFHKELWNKFVLVWYSININNAIQQWKCKAVRYNLKILNQQQKTVQETISNFDW